MGRDKSGDVEDNGDVSVERSRSDHGEENVIDLTIAACIHYTLGIHRSRGSIVLGFLTSCSWEGVAELRW